jgi:hypothetical protein
MVASVEPPLDVKKRLTIMHIATLGIGIGAT